MINSLKHGDVVTFQQEQSNSLISIKASDDGHFNPSAEASRTRSGPRGQVCRRAPFLHFYIRGPRDI